MKKYQVLPIAGIIIISTSISLLGLGCKGGEQAAKEAAKPITLNWWRAEGEEKDFAEIIKDYKSIHPNVTVKFQKIRPEELEQKLLEALAAGSGPDIVSLPNYTLGNWADKLAPLPPSLTLPFVEISGLLKKEPRWVLKKNPTIAAKAIQENFVDVVGGDAILDGKIYGLPINLDTLLLFYNRDLLNAAQIATPPLTWSDFKDAVQKMTLLDKTGFFVQHGAALGETDNIPYATDILSALMIQNSTPMVNSAGTTATFNQTIKANQQEFAPGLDAVRFYTDFSNLGKETYTWSREQTNAWQTFAAGRVGFIFAYWRDLPALRVLAPKINIGVANFPQIDINAKPIYYANYYLETVPKQSQYQAQAWDFIQFISTKPAVVNKFLGEAKKPTALRALVNKQLEDLDLEKPARQLLAARSWYHGFKPKVMEAAMLNMIRQVNAGIAMEQAINFAVNQVSQTLRR